eukprot:CAMPEP_0183712970 /NCGR_PEP_ID=MMETSP0737-20130205/7997_1 /TAXON_ID=385413 /ORGANISM="Thalassiosira miniscula, Strain CCMP1093" /LENGTH=699 /DNA_ID=CAMNT_0025941715 /DNA_START=330 /DNA_END=2429 /DNA_ORIENTATION=+
MSLLTINQGIYPLASDLSDKSTRMLQEDQSLVNDVLCDGIRDALFGDNSTESCECYYEEVNGEGEDAEAEDLAVSCKSDHNSNEVDIAMHDGNLSFIKTCGSYCDEENADNCRKFCVGESIYEGFSLCTASIDGESCSSCFKQPKSFSWSMRKSSCYGEDRFDFDCSNIAGRDYKEGHMCGHGGNITFVMNSGSYYGYGYEGYSGSSSGGSSYSGYSSSYSTSSTDDDGVGVGFQLFFIMLFFIGAMRGAQRQRAVEEARRRYFAGILRRSRQIEGGGSPQHVQVSRVMRTNSAGDQVELVVLSLLESSNVAIAKETITDGHAEFKHYEAGENDSVTTKLKEFVNDGNWRALRNQLSQIKQDGLSNDSRSFYFGIIRDEIEKTWPMERTHESTSYSLMLDEWVFHDNCVDCRVLRALVGISWAWHARSASLAHLVDSDQWALFHARSENAADELKAAKVLCPSDPLIYANAITVKRGLGRQNDDIMTVDTCLEALKGGIANEPLLYPAHTGALQYYCQKWHGSHEQMFSYARNVVSELPDGHALWVLIPMAHIERVMIESFPGYWRKPEVVNEIRDSFMHAFPGEAAFRSQATTPVDKAREWTCRNYFAYVLAAAGLCDEARYQIRIIGRRPTKGWPWVSIERYKKIIDALGFELNAPTANETIRHISLEEASPVSAVAVVDDGVSGDSTPLVDAVEIV